MLVLVGGVEEREGERVGGMGVTGDRYLRIHFVIIIFNFPTSCNLDNS